MAPSRGTLVSGVLSAVPNPPEISNSDPIHQCGEAALSLLNNRPDAVIRFAHGKLHAYPWRDVPACWLRLFEEGCLWAAWNIISAEQLREVDGVEGKSVGEDDGWISDVVALIDRALIVSGARMRRDWFDATLTALESILFNDEYLIPDRDMTKDGVEAHIDGPKHQEIKEGLITSERPSKRRRLDVDNFDIPVDRSIPVKFPATSSGSRTPKLINSFTFQQIPPSLTAFADHICSKDPAPLHFRNAINHWPALDKWPNPQYWHRITLGGRRLVPIEIGKSYTDEGWGQKLVPFGSFLRETLLANEEASTATLNSIMNEPQDDTTASSQTAYLAQHDLLSQISQLRKDIAVPDYCYISPTSPSSTEDTAEDEDENVPAEPLMNIWLGPAHTVSPCHTDPHHNILCQVFGRKYVRLYAPTETPKLYPMSSGRCEDTDENDDDSRVVNMANTSRVDVGLDVIWNSVDENTERERLRQAQDQHKEFPRFKGASFVETVLGPGECLYIPRGWWHYVTSLDVSCSVSFWWD